MHDTVRLLTGSAADWLDDYFEHEALKGYHASSSIIGTKVGPMSPRLRAGAALPQDGRARRPPRLVGVPQGRQRRLHPGARPGGPVVRRRDPARRAGRPRADPTTAGPSASCSSRRHRVPAPVVVSALDARRTFLDLVDPRELPDDLVDNVRRMSSAASRRRSTSPSTGCRCSPALPGHRRPLRRLHQHRPDASSTSSGPSTPRSTAGTPSGRSSTRPSSRSSTPTWRRPASTCMSCFVQYAPYELKRQRLGDRAGELRRQGPGRPRVALPRLRRPGAAPRGRHAGRHRARHRADRGQHLRRASSSPRRCTSSGPRPGWSQYATPIDGYYQCGSGTHPGGCVIGSPGRLASQRILRDRARKG